MKKIISAISIFIIACFGCAQEQTSVACLGKISASDTIARLAATSPTGSPAIVDAIYVKNGQAIEKGQKIARLRGYQKAAAALESAKAAAEMVKSEGELRIAEQQIKFDELAGTYNQNLDVLQKSPPRSEREKIDYQQKAIVRQLEQTKKMISLIKDNEKNAAARAQASVIEAQTFLDEFTILAPIAGEIIEVSAKLGEAVSEAGVCEIADTSVMYVEAEVYVSDITKVKVGDIAECAPEALGEEVLKGCVVEISPYVKNNRLFSQDPGEYADRKVIFVKIKLDDSEKVKSLIGSLVRVKIFVK